MCFLIYNFSLIVKNLQKCSESEGEKGFTDQEIYRLKKFVLKAKRQLEDGEYD